MTPKWLLNSRPIQRVILHWTAGRYLPNVIDRAHYHLLVDGQGQLHQGPRPVGYYLPHTRLLNTGSAGLAVCGMCGATGPQRPGNYPINSHQIEALCSLAAKIVRYNSLPINEQTVLCHSEVPRVYNIPQRGRWDIDWLQPYSALDPANVHELLRNKVRFYHQQG